MSRNRRTADCKGCRKFMHRAWPLAQQIDQRAAGIVGKGGKLD
jgi:hypothetical protein